MRRLSVWVIALASASALAAEPSFRWEVPKAIASAEVPGELNALGVPVRLRAVRSQLDIESLFDFFLREFEKADLFVTPKALQFAPPGGLSLTGLNVRSGVSYTVIFQPNPDRTTTVVLGEAEVARRQTPKASAAAPVFPGAKQVLTSRNESASLVTYVVAAKADEVASFYRSTLLANGYLESEGAYFNGREQVRIGAQTTHVAGELFIVVEVRSLAAPTPRAVTVPRRLKRQLRP